MLIKQPKNNLNIKKWTVRGAAVVIAVEVAGFLVSYAFWNKVNKDIDFRHQLQEKFPLVLESYYKVDEILGEGTIRTTDHECWSKEFKQP